MGKEAWVEEECEAWERRNGREGGSEEDGRARRNGRKGKELEEVKRPETREDKKGHQIFTRGKFVPSPQGDRRPWSVPRNSRAQDCFTFHFRLVQKSTTLGQTKSFVLLCVQINSVHGLVRRTIQ